MTSEILNEALSVAKEAETKDAWKRDWALSDIVRACVEAGMLEKALEAARGIKDNYGRARALVYVVGAYIKSGKLEKALNVTREIPDESEKSLALVNIARTIRESL